MMPAQNPRQMHRLVAQNADKPHYVKLRQVKFTVLRCRPTVSIYRARAKKRHYCPLDLDDLFRRQPADPRHGVAAILEPDMSPAEREAFEQSVQRLRVAGNRIK